MYKIMIIEDEANIRIELKTILENALYDVVLVDKFENVVKQIIDENPDIILLDVNLPNESGLDICMNLRKTSDIPIIFVTSKNTSMDELNCITLGGDDYISKPYNPPILLARISSILKRTKKITENKNVLTHKCVTLDVLNATVKYNDNYIELSKTEMKILYYLFLNKDKIVDRMSLVEYLWDNQSFIDDNTLSVNITRIRNKLSEIGVENFIETKRGLGYKI
ncbi:MAG: response regulator transcription factor [Intestinibacter sp.]|uniref:response regulator transcription factor n=1 Tax=Intestinibacter sp. TaxID=1965304 RepID=UPI003F14A478